MLLIILGAGASFDSLSRKPPPHPLTLEPDHAARPPLADQLFGDREDFLKATDNFRQVKDLIPALRTRRHGYSVERRLQELSDEAANYPVRRSQLIALRYYLQAIIRNCELEWKKETHDITNHNALMSEVAQWRYKSPENVSIVTFNYDRLIEDALQGIGVVVNGETFPHLHGYITDQNYKLFKLHGSVDWGRCTKLLPPVDKDTPQTDIVNLNIENAPIQYLSDKFVSLQRDNYPPGHVNGWRVVPAIAIPLENKSGFECPPNHVRVLTDSLSEADKILIIGWRATETDFLKLLMEGLPPDPQFMIVCGESSAGEATKDNLVSAGIRGSYESFDGGFTLFVEQRKALSWLQSATPK